MYRDTWSFGHLTVTLALLSFGLVACGQPEQMPPPEPVAAAEPGPNVLTQEELDAGWELLFDGHSLAGWHKYGADSVGSAWTVQDGAITLIPGEVENWQSVDGGDIASDSVFEDYELSLEWKIWPGGNSGIMYLVHESEEYEYPWQTGLEMQVLDNEGHADGQYEKHRAGDLYDLISAPDGLTKPVGEWNEVRIVKEGANVEHWINGTLGLSFTLWTDEWNEMVAGSKFSEMEGFGKYSAGRISLQDHGDRVAYRNIKARRL